MSAAIHPGKKVIDSYMLRWLDWQFSQPGYTQLNGYENISLRQQWPAGTYSNAQRRRATISTAQQLGGSACAYQQGPRRSSAVRLQPAGNHSTGQASTPGGRLRLTHHWQS